jgi:hypothetical protein
MGKPRPLVTFTATLAPGRCFTIDRDGGARFVLELPDTEVSAVASAVPEMRDVTLLVAIVTHPNG